MHRSYIVRKKIFDSIVRSRVPEGCVLPDWAIVVRWILFPLDTAYWVLGRSRGYQWQSDTWLIEGVRYTGAALRALAASQGQTYRITRTGETVTLELVHND